MVQCKLELKKVNVLVVEVEHWGLFQRPQIGRYTGSSQTQHPWLTGWPGTRSKDRGRTEWPLTIPSKTPFLLQIMFSDYKYNWAILLTGFRAHYPKYDTMGIWENRKSRKVSLTFSLPRPSCDRCPALYPQERNGHKDARDHLHKQIFLVKFLSLQFMTITSYLLLSTFH